MKTGVVIAVLICSFVVGWAVGYIDYDPDRGCMCWCRKPGICSTDHCWCPGKNKEWIEWIVEETPRSTPVFDPTETFIPTGITEVPPFPTWGPTAYPLPTWEPYP